MASDYADELADAVKSIGECPGVSLHTYERNRRNRATLETWLTKELEDQCYFECCYHNESESVPGAWTVYWQRSTRISECLGFAEADTEQEARALAAMQAVAALLKETNNNV